MKRITIADATWRPHAFREAGRYAQALHDVLAGARDSSAGVPVTNLTSIAAAMRVAEPLALQIFSFASARALS